MMTMTAFLAGAGGCAFAFVVGSLVEYAVHRLMHGHRLMGPRHLEHHKKADAQGVFGEFVDYLIAFPFVGGLGFLVSVPAGIGNAIGGVAYAFMAAYAHQLNHERPELVFWMPRPIHFLHHRHNLWRTNFGIFLDVWDRVFGTYEAIEWKPAKRPFEYPLRAFVDVSWFRRGGVIVPVARSGVSALAGASAADGVSIA